MMLKCFYILIWIAVFGLCNTSHRKMGLGNESFLGKKYLVYFVKSPFSKADDETWICAGAIVSPTQILTAAACLVEMDKIYAIAGYKIYVHGKDIENDECTKRWKKKIVKISVPKGEYKMGTDKQPDWMNIDLGVAIVDEPYNFTDLSYPTNCSYGAQSIIINYDKKNELENTRATALGWGGIKLRQHQELTKLENKSQILEEASTIIINKKVCTNLIKGNVSKEMLNKYMLCASGNGLIVEDGDETSMDPGPLAPDECPYNSKESSCVDAYFEVLRRRQNGKLNFTDVLNVTMKQPRLHKSNNNRTNLRRSPLIETCQNDHGGPLITWVGTQEMVLGVALNGISNPNFDCIGPRIYVSTAETAKIIKCLLETNETKRNICNNDDKKHQVHDILISWPKDVPKISSMKGNQKISPFLRQGNEEQPLHMRPTKDLGNTDENGNPLRSPQLAIPVESFYNPPTSQTSTVNPYYQLQNQQPVYAPQANEQQFGEQSQGQMQQPMDLNNQQFNSLSQSQVSAYNQQQSPFYIQPQVEPLDQQPMQTQNQPSDSFSQQQPSSYNQQSFGSQNQQTIENYKQQQAPFFNNLQNVESFSDSQMGNYYQPQTGSQNQSPSDTINSQMTSFQNQPKKETVNQLPQEVFSQSAKESINPPTMETFNQPLTEPLNSPNQPQLDSFNQPMGLPGQLQMGSPDQQRMGSPNQEQMGSPDQQQMGSPDQQQMGSLDQQQMGSPDQQQMGSPDQQQIGSLDQQHMGLPDQTQMGQPNQKQMGQSNQQQMRQPNQQQMGQPNQQQMGQPDQQQMGQPDQQQMGQTDQQQMGQTNQEQMGQPNQQQISSLNQPQMASLGQQPAEQFEQTQTSFNQPQNDGNKVPADSFNQLQTNLNNQPQMGSQNQPVAEENNQPQGSFSNQQLNPSYKPMETTMYASRQGDSFNQQQSDTSQQTQSQSKTQQIESFQGPQAPQTDSFSQQQVDLLKQNPANLYIQPQLEQLKPPQKESFNPQPAESSGQQRSDTFKLSQTDPLQSGQMGSYNIPQNNPFKQHPEQSYNQPQNQFRKPESMQGQQLNIQPLSQRQDSYAQSSYSNPQIETFKMPPIDTEADTYNPLAFLNQNYDEPFKVQDSFKPQHIEPYKQPNSGTYNNNQHLFKPAPVEPYGQPHSLLLNKGQSHSPQSVPSLQPFIQSKIPVSSPTFDTSHIHNILRERPPTEAEPSRGETQTFEQMYSQFHGSGKDPAHQGVTEQTFEELYRNLHDGSADLPHELQSESRFEQPYEQQFEQTNESPKILSIPRAVDGNDEIKVRPQVPFEVSDDPSYDVRRQNNHDSITVKSGTTLNSNN